MDTARVMMERWKQFLLSPTGVYLYAVITSGIGVLILLGFFSLFLSPGALPLLMPLMIAFNAAGAGYGLLDKCQTFPRPAIALMSIAVVLALVGVVGLAYLQPWRSPFAPTMAIPALVGSVAATCFGAWIARKKHSDH